MAAGGFYLEFEKPIVELEKKIREMKEFSSDGGLELSSEIVALERKLEKLQTEIFSKLTRWQRVQLARHPKRPYSLDYIQLIFTDWVELHGDRGYADDKAVVCGFAKLDNEKVLIVGQQKGRDTKQKLERNFGMMHPEGYRKALRLMKTAARFGRPIIIFIDTPGAFPGVEAEERGQAEAIARNILEMFRLEVPIIIAIIGEGASGGALGIGIGDRILMLENSWYSVISPEGCAAILWRDQTKAPDAAEALRLTAADLMQIKVIDKILPEPTGGAHRNHQLAAQIVKAELLSCLAELKSLSTQELLARRLEKFRVIGIYDEV
ncbi:MAG: acetyl-CoA carboxylase carboxyltransferase subunit alpha [candidate division Zixibacteria bacterium]|nr:acetyl-CoA carboxylase carboxyltransferase subunit alpha [candidate division Zixibacteria bacterium]